MNILFASTQFPQENRPYYCVYLYQQAKALMDLGHRVDVLIPWEGGDTSHVIKEHFRGLDMYRIGFTRTKASLLTYGIKGSFASLATQLLGGYDCLSIHLAPDCIKHSLISCAKQAGVKTFLHFHGQNVWHDYNEAHPMLGKVLAWRRKFLLQSVDGLIGVSQKVCDRIREGLPHTNSHVVYNGVDPDLFVPGEKANVFTVSIVANLIPIKGHLPLFHAFSYLKNIHSDVQLVVVGTGPMEGTLKTLAVELGIEKQTVFTGAMDYPKVANCLSRSHVFAMPSYFEALGCVYLEAMACGTPVVGCAGQGIEEIIFSGENGYLVKPQESKELGERLCYLYEYPEKREQMGRAGRKTVFNGYTWKHSAQSLFQVYQS
ncbi:MAG TPA: hypothetical protein DER23_07565 [Clostridiales bacterium]|jgi:glycosyltransferase involved in cell wall biosynthesis|nr:hypothetical protein [Clostridiales bacterium]